MHIRFQSDTGSHSLAVDPGTSVADAAVRAGVPLNTRCGGNGSCRGCKIDILQGAVETEDGILPGQEGSPPDVLACQARCTNRDTVVHVPATSLLETSARIETDFVLRQVGPRAARPSHAGDREGPAYGIAVDLGTTTVVVMLVDLASGDILGRAAETNQQLHRADDVASRISYASTPARLQELQSLLVQETLRPLIDQVLEESSVPAASLYRVAVAGNTVMSHLLLGLDPTSIGHLPFEPVMREYPPTSAVSLGLDLVPNAVVDVLPSISGYVGGDIVADLRVAGMEDGKFTLLVDIGTNGEIVLARDGRLYASATAAGPAFEGAGLSFGMRAAPGAIERLSLAPGGGFDMEVIGDQAPRGLCGSAAIDFVALGRTSGLINTYGRFDREILQAWGREGEVALSGGTSLACVLVHGQDSQDGKPVLVSEYDVSQILKAKAAIYAGIQTLVAQCDTSLDDLERIVLAGGFARHIHLRHAVVMGLLPDVPLDRYDLIGNGSLAGAYLRLMEADAEAADLDLIERPEIVELNLDPHFETRFIDALALPEPDDPRQGDPS